MLGRNTFHRGITLVGVLVAMLFTACSDTMTAPSTQAYSVGSGQLTADDIAGTWQWEETSRIAARPFAVVQFGIAPEGPITHITCVSGGELTISALTETTFIGSATQSSQCRTKGGVVFDPSAVFPATLQVVNGEVLGGSFRFDFLSAGTPCPHQGAAVVRNALVETLHGSGDCELPGANLLGQYKDIQFMATRP